MTAEQENFANTLLSNKDSFSAFVYTPWQDAIVEWGVRQEDANLETPIDALLPQGVPAGIRQGKNNICIFRNIATPNYEMHRFMTCADVLKEFRPVVFEFTKDFFNNRNETKFALGKLRMHHRINETGSDIYEYARIIDINSANNRPFDTLTTHWGQSLLDFHHELTLRHFPNMADNLIEISAWIKAMGPTPKEYYARFLSIFLKHGILFENFLLEGQEARFTKEVILPALISIHETTGKKPLIVNLAPVEIESASFWHGYPHFEKAVFEERLRTSEQPN
jgi:hypothetical protein